MAGFLDRWPVFSLIDRPGRAAGINPHICQDLEERIGRFTAVDRPYPLSTSFREDPLGAVCN
jgi:hypothetical protein